jgi:hypothetical protein
MTQSGHDMHTDTYQSMDYHGFTLNENYGTWDLQFEDKANRISRRIDIFYCPFCGKKLNRYDWATKRRKEGFEEYTREYVNNLKVEIEKLQDKINNLEMDLECYND